MAEPARPVTTISDFLGLSDVPRSSINQPPGMASEQVNCCSVNEGALDIRLGIQEVHFEDA